MSPRQTRVLSKRGRRSTVPLEQRQAMTRVKKRHLERRRRAHISEKMTELYDLAMSLVGGDPRNHSWLHKTTLLNDCIKVLQTLSYVMREMPEVQASIKTVFGQRLNSKTVPLFEKDKENMPPPTLIQSSNTLTGKTPKIANATPESGYHGSFASCLQQQSHNQPNFSADTDVTFTPIRRLLDRKHHHLPLSQFLNTSKPQDYPMDLSFPKSHDKGHQLWRPYAI
ncbi:unnamed protein product [Mesocestoides corti]|uniref:BHLH domain-containing protein n=2 Tax=Mesocestoides corti TaxID=53468 RepID=A0A0R3UCT8_MESCO|nr:unnamed protein product [Mesocestoides corti]